MKNLIVYVPATGEIVSHIQGPDMVSHGPEFASIDGDSVSGEQFYVVAGKVTARPVFPCSFTKTAISADGVDAASMTGVPAGTVATVGQTTTPIDDGELHVAWGTPATVRVRLVLFPYQTLTATVVAS